MEGSATFTIATSRTTMNWAATITARANQRFRESREVIYGSNRCAGTRSTLPTMYRPTRIPVTLRDEDAFQFGIGPGWLRVDCPEGTDERGDGEIADPVAVGRPCAGQA